MAGAMGHFVYPSDDTTSYRTRLDASNAAVGGFVASSGSEPTLPKGVVMRHIWVESAGGVRRRIYVADTTLGVWTASGGTVALPVEGSAGTVNFTVRGHIGEVRRNI